MFDFKKILNQLFWHTNFISDCVEKNVHEDSVWLGRHTVLDLNHLKKKILKWTSSHLLSIAKSEFLSNETLEIWVFTIFLAYYIHCLTLL